ncbi:P-loop containing nucleoside triphosphate hydrolase protein [Syncephalis pseudoplumigaleata]|uniref:P-loop containing nucleoside triphosphate hydrolase protein n=1 Tax=Syncephalis pseudoplumigaleata TaxID=1712513 RepID=A0A4P9YR44_9FUNG|nr:P-loop containing nucleoside triphosphate hydrolase protein [Syncephalis pseudoplumigaleata]|eukprot:RKP22287.1 P-loop containing nucleoside triphosphate hydrolase protein [Syncephalis pseudoplumigaleata]
MVYLQPRLAFNLQLDMVDDEPCTLYLRRASLSISTQLPIASTITIARVSSPRAADRTLLAANLQALTDWFRGCSRAVRQNDIIHVTIDEEQARIGSMVTEAEVEMDPRDEAAVASHIRASEANDVYFKVTKLSCTATEFDGTARVVPSVTTVSQTGVAQSRAPSSIVRPSGKASEYDSLVAILRSGMHPWAAELQMRCTVLVTGVRGVGKRTLVADAARQLGVHLLELNCYELQSDSEAKTMAVLNTHFDRAMAFAPCVLLLKHIEVLAKKSTVAETGQEPLITMAIDEGLGRLAAAHRSRGHPIMVVATTDDVDALSIRLLGCFPQQVELAVPDEQQRYRILCSLTEHVPLALDVSLVDMANQTAAFVAKDLKHIVHQAAIQALARARQVR